MRRHRDRHTATPVEFRAWPTRETDPLAILSERDRRGILGSAAAIAIALGTAGAQAATSIYGTRTAGRQNQQAMQAQERGDVRADAYNREALTQQRELADKTRALEEQALAEKKAAREAAMAMDRQRWTDYVDINRPHWQLGSQVLGNLYDLAGYRGGGMPGSASVPAPAMSETGPAPASASFGNDTRPGRGMPLADLAMLGSSAPVAPAARSSRRSYAPAMPFPQVSTPRISLQDLMLMTQPSASAARVG